MDINVFLSSALTKVKQDKNYKNILYEVMAQYSDIDDCKNNRCPYSGQLSSGVLSLLLLADCKKIGLELANWALSIFAGPHTVDREAFRIIMRLKGRLGRSMRMMLPHIPLSFYQIYELSKTADGGMALDILLPLMCKEDIFTNEDILEILDNSKASFEMKKLAVSYTKQLIGETEKTAVMESFICQAE